MIVKVFDNALIVHEQNLFDLIEMSKLKTKNTINEYNERHRITEELHKKAKEQYEKCLEKYQEQIAALQTTLAAKEKYIHEHDERMADLLEIVSRDKSCIEMSRILKKINNYISEAEDQQHKQVATLLGISHVMSLAEKFDDKQETFSKETQTDLTLPNNPFPEYKTPKLSGNYFYTLYKPCPDLNTGRVLHDCCIALDESNGEQQFYKQYGEYLIKNYSKSQIEIQLIATA